MEGLLPKLYGDDATEIPGARSLLDSLIAANHRWAIVTSGTTPLVSGWLRVLNLPKPEHLIAAEDVINGKPDPSKSTPYYSKAISELLQHALTPIITKLTDSKRATTWANLDLA